MTQYDQYFQYITKDGDRWDSIAYEMYGDPLNYEPIVVSNPHVNIDPILKAGITLQIPVIEISDTLPINTLPPWKA